MNRIILLGFFAGILFGSCRPSTKHAKKLNEATASLYDSVKAPFYHGVASGDPLTDRVIIWTRVTPPDSIESVPVTWEVSPDAEFGIVEQSGAAQALLAKDYTVKVDVGQLQPGKYYYYRFSALDKTSVIGRTKTLPLSADSVKLAVVSCANWEAGFFHAYDKIAERADVDAVIHLGDFIYEYGKGKRGEEINRYHLPENEIVSLLDYRTRYAQYRLDRGLMHMSEQHPLIAIWDDHEVANDSYKTGAQNHQPEEGDYEQRKNVARQAYYEWLPVREGAKLYREFEFGNLVDLIMLDERIEGRTKPVDSLSDPTFMNEDRTMIGPEQLAWFEAKLKESNAIWKVIGNQVIFSDVNYGKHRKSVINLDSWDGFPAEKKRVINSVQTNQIKDVIFVTGDSHSSWAMEVSQAAPSKGVIGVEFGTTSVSSGNYDERSPVEEVKMIEADLQSLNPHIKYINFRDHGYLLLTLYLDKAEGEWYYMENIRALETEEFLGTRISVNRGSAHLNY